jgi:hypothetical protein
MTENPKDKPKTLMTIPQGKIDKLDNIKKEKFVEFYTRDEVRGNISVTCEAVGIVRQTYYDWLEKDKTFRDIIKDLKMSMCDDMEQILISRAVDKSDTALIYWLKYNHPQYKETGINPVGDVHITIINYAEYNNSSQV